MSAAADPQTLSAAERRHCHEATAECATEVAKKREKRDKYKRESEKKRERNVRILRRDEKKKRE